MFISHPIDGQHILNISSYKSIKCCNKNPTHVDFYLESPPQDERGNPSYTIVFETKDERDEWFSNLRGTIEDRAQT